tara:strand:- start:52 stop:1857 length:1806 start_codon:yes stop_codon:yes gene_type:complete
MTSVAEYNNNPGNIRPPKGLTYDGQIGIDDRGFAIFATKEAGRGALMQDIRAKQKQGLNNPNSFIDKYAPASQENPEEGRDNYKIRMAQHLGLKSTTDPFPEGSEEKIADLIASFEAGTPAAATETKPSASNPFAGRTPKARTGSSEVLPALVPEETNTEKVMGAVGKAGEYIATKALENPEIPAAAGVGLAKGALEKILQNPEKNLVGEGEKTLQQVQAAQDAAKAAQIRVNEIQRVTSGREPVDLESLQREFESSRTSNRVMADELRAAQSDLRAMPKTYVPPVEPVVAETAEQILARTTPGAAGAQKWVEAMSDDVPTALAQKARNMRGDNPKGGQAIIDAQSAAVQRLEGMGLGDFKLDPTKTLSLPTAETTRLEQELAAKQAQEAAEQAARAQEVETRRLAAEADLARQRQLATQRVEDARRTKIFTGEQAADAKRAANTAAQRAASQTKSDAGKLETARVSASTAKQIARDAEAAQPGALTMMGREAGRRFAEKAPIIGNVLGAVGATISTSEAVDRYKQGDYSGSVLGAIEAALNAASMAPPTSPAGLLTKGVGTVGSLGMIPVWIAHDYFGNKGPWAPKKEPQKARGGLTLMQ